MKKKFKDTKVGGLLKGLVGGALNTLPFPTNFLKLDRDGDGKVTLKDFKPIELAGGVGILAFLLYFKIVDLNQILELIKALTGG